MADHPLNDATRDNAAQPAASAGRSVGQWLILLGVWMVGLAVWVVYIAAVIYLFFVYVI